MAAIDPSVLDAIRVVVNEVVTGVMPGVVAEAIRPLDERLGRVEAEQQAQSVRLGGIEAEQQAQSVRLGGIEAEQQAQRSVLQSMEITLDERFTRIDERFTRIDERFSRIDERFTHLEERLIVLETQVGTIEARTARLSSDLLDLTDKVAELTERVAEGFQTFKREVAQAFRDIGATQSAQQRYVRQINELRERVELLERRINRLEDQSGGVI